MTGPGSGELADLCSGTVRLALGLDAERDGDAEALAARFQAALDELEQRAAQAGIADPRVQLALYALCAWIDERVLLSELPVRRAWAANPLQLRRFDDLSAGDEFYVKLESLRGSAEPDAIDALEVYALCLALGFRGKLAASADRRRLLLDQVAAEIARSRCAPAASPIAAPAPPDRSSGLGVVLAPMAAILVLLACYGVAHAWTARAVETLAALEAPHAP